MTVMIDDEILTIDVEEEEGEQEEDDVLRKS